MDVIVTIKALNFSNWVLFSYKLFASIELYSELAVIILIWYNYWFQLHNYDQLV